MAGGGDSCGELGVFGPFLCYCGNAVVFQVPTYSEVTCKVIPREGPGEGRFIFGQGSDLRNTRYEHQHTQGENERCENNQGAYISFTCGARVQCWWASSSRRPFAAT